MSTKIAIVCFDTINDYEKNLNEEIASPETTLEILDYFTDVHLFLDSEKIQKSSSEIKYIIQVNNLEDNLISYEIFVLNDLSFIHDVSLEADANLLFINLEDKNTLDDLEAIIDYINDSSRMEMTTYLIGLYKNKIKLIVNQDEIKNLFEDQKLDYKFYQLKFNKNEGPDHICLYENKKFKNIERKNSLKNHNKDKKGNIENNTNLMDIIEEIFMELYDKKVNNQSNGSKKSNSQKGYYNYDFGKSDSDSKAECQIF